MNGSVVRLQRRISTGLRWLFHVTLASYGILLFNSFSVALLLEDLHFMKILFSVKHALIR